MNKTALITGAAKRVGKALSEHLAEQGWNVILHFNTSEKQVKLLAETLKSKYPSQCFEVVKANLEDSSEVLDLIPTVMKNFGAFQLLINNASVFEPGYIQNTSAELFDNQISVNLKAPFLLMRDFYKFCKVGNIVNLTDTRITNNKSNFSAYSISKKGLWELTKMAALEFSPKIRVNAIAPGVTLAPVDKDESYLQNLAKNIPMKSPGGLLPILKSLDYILENEHLTGQLLFADGGENLGQNT